MKVQARFLLAIFLVFLVEKTLAESECSDGETKVHEDGCNNCFCTNGVRACTLMACGGEHILERREAEECAPGDTKRVACNKCKCIKGSWACSRKACLNKRDTEECPPGETKEEDCNKCFCTEEGLWVCNRNLCLKKKRDIPTKVLADLKNVPCFPSDTFIFECNRCQCNFERTRCTCVKAQNCTLTT